MLPDGRFISLPDHFWASVRAISESTGYSDRNENRVKAPTRAEILKAIQVRDLDINYFLDDRGCFTEFGLTLRDYLKYRADALNDYVKKYLMNAEQAGQLFRRLKKEMNPQCPIPMNKQRGDKKAPAYFTGIINMLIEDNLNGNPCNYDPGKLITVVQSGQLVYTSSRRLDGAFPSTANPVAVWEVKEQYYTTTFGSRVAAGIYESLLDGMELAELRRQRDIFVKHYFMLDAYDTWWLKGRSYLCRIVDMLHMGYVDEVLFGYEVVERLPSIVQGWINNDVH